MMRFIDRETEMSTLEREYSRKGASLVILYGRRRVGKTTLISKFIEDKKALFFLATEESEAQNRDVFRQKAADFIGSDLLRSAAVSDWDTIFKAVMNEKFDTKPVIVIDEFQYLGKANPAFPSVFQRIWESLLKDKSVMVILCGSLISMMVSQTLSYDSPLYGRRTAQIRLGQVPFKYYSEFFNEKSGRQLIESYAVTGGVPKYIELFSQHKDVYKAIQECILNRSSYLYDEPRFLLQQEVTEVGSYFSLIKAIAAGNHKLSEISGALGIPQTNLTKYLKTLADLDLVEREVPVTEDKPEKSKRGLYRLKDNYIAFWFAFIYPNLSFIESGHDEIVMDKIRKNFVDRRVAYVYEDVCRERMWDMNAENVWPFHFNKLGRYWDSGTEIDITATDDEGKNLILGECKYWAGPVGANILRELESKADNVMWNKKSRKVWYVLFSAAGFTDDLKELAKHRDDLVLTGSV